MAVKKTLGGDRLGSGNRMKQRMHGYERSNHNLGMSFKSTMAAGVLYPCYVQPALNGDTFDININAFVRTIPTQAPLFGSFKLQVDFFQIPIRLYQAILHNNTLELGLNASKVIFPKLQLETKMRRGEQYGITSYQPQVAATSLVKYLGISGLGRPQTGNPQEVITLKRKFLGIPMLAYYDIFKNYYANKQEDNAYVITSEQTPQSQVISQVTFFATREITYTPESNTTVDNKIFTITTRKAQRQPVSIIITGKNLNLNSITLNVKSTDNAAAPFTIEGTIQKIISDGYMIGNISPNRGTDSETLTLNFANKLLFYTTDYDQTEWTITAPLTADNEDQIILQPFALKNIDAMRKRLLTSWDLGEEVVIDKDESLAPYNVVTGVVADGTSRSKFTMNGLCVKTYQSDMFNNWLNSEWIDGLNGINKTTAISTASGSFTIDTLNLARKLYDYFNRVAISGGTYEDWQEVTWGEEVTKRAEKPIYIGGMSSEVMFEEVVSTAATTEQPLGSIGGRGTLNGRKGGKIVAKIKEPSFIMGIVSLTPRVCYTQGNEWYNTELDNLEDLHKPELDQIGFQNAMTEQLAWWDAVVNENGLQSRTSYGKVPAWLNYMTAVDKAYGDFANEKAGFMILDRDYAKSVTGGVADVTTYIDPSKFNYAFAQADLSAQNFWTFISFDITARRKMSAKQIPNL